MIEFTVKDMSCGHCVARVTAAVKSVDAQAQVVIDLPAKRVQIESARDAAHLAAALAAAGYPPEAKG